MLATLDSPRTPLVAGALLATATVLTTVATDDGPVLCPFRRCTGGYCPGCGGTRAARALAAGDVAGAWALHPWIVVLAVQGALVGLLVAVAQFLPSLRTQLRSWSRPAIVANGAFAVGLWGFRMAIGHIPVPFG